MSLSRGVEPIEDVRDSEAVVTDEAWGWTFDLGSSPGILMGERVLPRSSDILPWEAMEAVTPSFMPRNRTKSLVLTSSSSVSSNSSSTTTMSLLL